MQHAADEVVHAGRRFGASTAAHRRSGAACDCALVAHRQSVGRRFRRTHRRAVWRRRRAHALSRPRGCDRHPQRADGIAARRRRARDLPPAVALRAARSVGPSVHPASDDRRADRATPIIAALTRQTMEDLWSEYREELAAMDVGPLGRITTLIWDGRFSLVTELPRSD